MAVARMVAHHTVAAHTDVRRRLTVAGRQVMADPMAVGPHPPTAAEERHRMAEAGQLRLTAVGVAARADPAVAEDTPLLEAGAIVVAAEAEATLAVDVTKLK